MESLNLPGISLRVIPKAKIKNAGSIERLLSGNFTSSSYCSSAVRKSASLRHGKTKVSTRATMVEPETVETSPSETSLPLTLQEVEVLPETRPQPVNSGSSYSLEFSSGSQQDVQVLVASPSSVVTDKDRQVDRFLNASLIAAAAAYALGKIVTVDQDYWQGWTFYEIIKYAPVHNWSAYEEALRSHPVLAKMMISGIVYSIGDWMAQCYEGKPVLDFSRTRMLRSGLVGFCLHGSLSHYYYHVCEALFPFKEWWVVPLKVGFDQTIWSAFWNSVYFITLGLLRLENPVTIVSELRSTFFPLLTAGWKLWPFAHLVTYGLIPVEQRLLWVDCVELVWVTILSMYSNEKAEARSSEDAEKS
ncbi:uncharacterized protein LOC9653217 [Selaginella moellendorffii]|nr:uncharacterized protein LOC9653217 [Selaginella moellendorffii]XP_024538974.1 uncharacterized protein LOC9653217 [Selaginella moellendorffii]XP_024538975.1 uncharacterized protein LOC9653217 [Selaginella moellendorffii]XP_024538976.1 uncharacterized protein LOC9653217 [Selaginella moellendorffii]|eukprot:XP_002978201.2 uncharacterized protein LOC9653217 [Selaginella moellendorffii]